MLNAQRVAMTYLEDLYTDGGMDCGCLNDYLSSLMTEPVAVVEVFLSLVGGTEVAEFGEMLKSEIEDRHMAATIDYDYDQAKYEGYAAIRG